MHENLANPKLFFKGFLWPQTTGQILVCSKEPEIQKLWQQQINKIFENGQSDVVKAIYLTVIRFITH